MLCQEDWFMRQIEAMTRAIAQLLLHRSPDAGMSEIFRADLNAHEAQLDALLSSEGPCAAENRLFEEMDTSDLEWLEAALHFYGQLSKMPESELASHDFSREEILSGLRSVCRAYGYENLPLF